MMENKLLAGTRHHSEETRRKISLAKTGKPIPALQTHGKSETRLYNLYTTMLSRCYNPHREKYKDYGGRGITVCNEWHNSVNFIQWAEANGYREGLQLDRINNAKGYSPENCRWVTPKENSRNRRNTKYLTLNGETKCVAEWCESVEISQFTVYWWYRNFGREYTEKRLSEVLNEKSA